MAQITSITNWVLREDPGHAHPMLGVNRWHSAVG